MKKIFLLLCAGLVLVLAGCSTPAEEAARADQRIATQATELAKEQSYYDAAVRAKDADVRSAEEWSHNDYPLGIPGSGWVALLIFGGILGLIGLVGFGFFVNARVGDRNAVRARREDQAHKIELARIQRGSCNVCGADPKVATEIKQGSS